MSEQIPAGWYPDPKDTSDPRPERYWDGKGWTATTRPAPGAETPAPGAEAPAAAPGAAADGDGPTVIEGRVLDDGPTVRYPEMPTAVQAPPKPRRRPSRPVVVAAAVAAVAGLAVGSGITYLAMDDDGDGASAARPFDGRYRLGGNGSDGFGFPGLPGQNGGQGGGSGNGQGGDGPGGGNGSGQGNGQGGNGLGRGGRNASTAVDVVNGISLPVPSGWQGATTPDGHAALSIGSYTCPDGKGTCSLGGAFTDTVEGSDAKQAALTDIAAAAKEAYGDVKSHEELKSEAVTVAGRSGYLVRWKVDAPQGNDGYVETVVFPGAKAGSLVAVHLGFDIADKAPDLAQMDTIVKGIATAQVSGPGGT
ncbi:DUF2510 domain-containing protein [Kitasatospora sp. NPDC007106]|uniref:DUF2510 domain-containing protein n=1 Tax=Kitasatospora sp. NPDC007106 TaxID=3156914 RepID=UPI0033E8DF91